VKLACSLVLAIALVGCATAPRRPAQKPIHVEEPASDWGGAEVEDEMDITIPGFNPLLSKDPTEQLTVRFRGVDRKEPKTSIAPGSIKDFATVVALIDSLPKDSEMLKHQPPIKRDTMTRAVEERRNVRVRAWIYAIKYESDQDWHVIIGTNPSAGAPTFFNAEVSGLPAPNVASRAKLLKVRNQLATIFHFDLPGGSNYFKYPAPVAVVVEGSLFFDVDHPAGEVGPHGMEPGTAWEIHPVTKLTLQ
jgi:hypothetical protein